MHLGISSFTGPVIVDRIRTRGAGHGKRDRAEMNQHISSIYLIYLKTCLQLILKHNTLVSSFLLALPHSGLNKQEEHSMALILPPAASIRARGVGHGFTFKQYPTSPVPPAMS